MIKKIKNHLEKICCLQSGDAVIAGVSGGADSVCLLCVLQKICAETGAALYVVHVNHHLRTEADDDQTYVEMLCSQWDIPCRCYSYDVKNYAKEHGISTEEAGRRLRYEAFYDLRDQLTADGDIRIAVAHTMEDNAETMLLNLFRGTGLKGLRGIPVSRGDIIRPLLCVRRSEIEEWLTAQGIGWRNDCSNDTDDYTRNKIRHKMIPIAEKEINENAVLHMNRTAEQLAMAEDYLEAETEKAWEACVRPLGQKDELSLPPDADTLSGQGEYGCLILTEPLLALHPCLRSCVLLRTMQKAAGTTKDISAVHVQALEGLFDMQCGRQLHLAYGMRAERTYDGVIIRKKTADAKCGREDRQAAGGCGNDRKEAAEAAVIKIPGSTEISGLGVIETRIFPAKKQNFCEIPKDRYTKWFDYDKIKDTVCIRTRQAKDYLAIDARGGTQTLKSYFINQKIPREEREQLLLIADGKHIMWIVGRRGSHGYYIDDSTKNILEIKIILF